MFMTDDPIADFNRYDAEQQARLKKLPICARCGEHIQQDKAVCIHGVEFYCDECLDELRERIGGD